VPLLASVPLLGKLFQSRSLIKQNNELLVIVTPEIVRPVPQGHPLPQLGMPTPLGGPDVLPRTPGMTVTGPVPATNPNPSVPMENLLESIRQQSTMRIQDSRDLSTAASELPLPMPAVPAPVPPAPTQAPSPQNPAK
jgi:pilus assembly protein CpaC